MRSMRSMRSVHERHVRRSASFFRVMSAIYCREDLALRTDLKCMEVTDIDPVCTGLPPSGFQQSLPCTPRRHHRPLSHGFRGASNLLSVGFSSLMCKGISRIPSISSVRPVAISSTRASKDGGCGGTDDEEDVVDGGSVAFETAEASFCSSASCHAGMPLGSGGGGPRVLGRDNADADAGVA